MQYLFQNFINFKMPIILNYFKFRINIIVELKVINRFTTMSPTIKCLNNRARLELRF